jgi:hypothetical protein
MISSYTLPHRVFTARPYPVLAPNGSAIIIYGYENGLRIIWRGGRPFLPVQKQKSAEAPIEKPNGARENDDAVMIIDSDDEEPAPAPPKIEEPRVDFEDEETEIDPTHPYENILRHIDIPLGTRVLDLAVPSLLPETARSELDAVPPILSDKIVVSAVCADSSLKVVALPLTPPHSTNTDPSNWGVQVLSMSATVSHNEVPKGVSMTFSCQENEEEDLRHSRSQRRSSQSKTGSNASWELLVATHAAEASGTLLLYRVPVLQDAKASYSLSSENLLPVQRHALPTPAKSISFNPFPPPSERHSHLLVAFSDGYVKVLSCLNSKSSRSSRTAQSADENEAVELEGRWLITLYSVFEQSAAALGLRKTIVDASWVLSGKAIMVLHADGEWGVWDVEGAGPGSEPGPLRGQSSVHGVTGGSLTAFSVSGRIVGTPQTGKSQATSTGPAPPDQRTKFAPMTPSTRRVREDTLFKGAQTFSSSSLCGGIAVIQTNSSRSPLSEESVLIRHGDQIALIPSLLSLWRNAVKASGTFDASSRCRVTGLDNITLLGERLTGINHLPAATRAEREVGQREFDILITAEHRLIILAPKLMGAVPRRRQSVADSERQSVAQPSEEADQLMLSRGELDVDGMDRVLNGLSGPIKHSAGVQSPFKRSRIFS